MSLGIYGGTFSPVHFGHVAAARAFYEQMKLDRLLIIPAYVPPHKQVAGDVPFEDRFNMCRISFDGVGEVSDIEARRGGKSYTYETLLMLEEAGQSDIYLLCGTDMLLSFDKWYRFEEIFGMATLALALRRDVLPSELCEIDEKIAYFENRYGARIKKLDVTPVDISSTEVREMIARGEDVSPLIPAAEYEYIRQKGLYVNG